MELLHSLVNAIEMFEKEWRNTIRRSTATIYLHRRADRKNSNLKTPNLDGRAFLNLLEP